MARKQKEKSLQTKKELMAQALDLFGEKGFFATTIAEITSKAGYAKGNFYRHWDGKDEIFLEIIKAKMEEYRLARDKVIEKAGSLEDVVAIIMDFLESMIDDKNWSKVFLEFTIHASRSEKLRRELNKSVYRLSNDIFSGIVGPYVDSGYPPDKMGALNTALFEGFLIHNILETNILTKHDLRDAALSLAVANGKK